MNAVRHFMDRHGLTGTAGLVAISGGPDSVALAHALHSVTSIELAHVNHHLRGAESDADETFVRAFAEQLGRVLHVYQGHAVPSESEARDLRYGWLTELATSRPFAWVAVGHHADDQAETVLHHFLRGSGPQGLAGIPERRELAGSACLVRPLLTTSRAEILAYLSEHQLAHRVDSSNAQTRFTRNRLRHELLPMLERDYNPRLAEILTQTAQQMREIHDWLAEQATELLQRSERPRAGAVVVLHTPDLAPAKPPVLRELFRLLWQREGWPMGKMSFRDWDLLVQMVSREHDRHSFPGLVEVRRVALVLQLSRLCH